MKEFTKELASWAAELEYDDIPSSVISTMKKCLLDTIGCAAAGSGRKEIQDLYNGLITADEIGKASVWFHNCCTPMDIALLINGAINHSVELDDLHKPSKIHAGTVIVPTILTIGSVQHVSGKEMLTAMAVGYEVMLRSAMAIGVDSHRRRGWHGTATCGAFGAAAAAGHILGLNSVQMANAFGLAGTSTGGLMAYTADGSMSKRYHAGMAAMHGYLAAKASKAGFTGPTYVFEAPDGGYAHAVSDNYDLDRLTNELNKVWYCKDMGFKYYACCGHIHQAIDCAISLKNEYCIKPESIRRVDIYTYDVSGMNWGFIEPPKNTVEAQFSFPYAVAVALIDGEAFLSQFSPDRLNDSKINDLARLICVHIDDKFTSLYPEKWSSGVRIKTDEVDVYKEVIGAKGDPSNPLSNQEIINKFRVLSKDVLSYEEQNTLIESIERIDSLESISVLVDILR